MVAVSISIAVSVAAAVVAISVVAALGEQGSGHAVARTLGAEAHCG